jgi:hypothetical protein
MTLDLLFRLLIENEFSATGRVDSSLAPCSGDFNLPQPSYTPCWGGE